MKLVVRNFGPIKNVEINNKKLIILIGPQASGKSVIAKLMAIFNDVEFLGNKNLNKFLAFYNIEFLQDDTFIEYEHLDFKITFSNGKVVSDVDYNADFKIDEIVNRNLDELIEKAVKEIKTDKKNLFSNLPENKLNEILERNIEKTRNRFRRSLKLELRDKYLTTPLYIPTERLFVASISDFLFNFIKSNINLPECVIDFGARFENARKKHSNYKVPFLDNVEFAYENGLNKLKIGNDKTINFTQSSSGMQAVIPMAILIEYFNNQKLEDYIIEEPELNLYPTTQKKIVEFISSKCLGDKRSLIVTTHSPYILTSFANLIQAANVAKLSAEKKSEVLKIIPEECWIDFEQVSAYYINNGTAVDILDYENKTIDATAIDDVSETIAYEFESLLNLKYQNQL